MKSDQSFIVVNHMLKILIYLNFYWDMQFIKEWKWSKAKQNHWQTFVTSMIRKVNFLERNFGNFFGFADKFTSLLMSFVKHLQILFSHVNIVRGWRLKLKNFLGQFFSTFGNVSFGLIDWDWVHVDWGIKQSDRFDCLDSQVGFLNCSNLDMHCVLKNLVS